MSTPADEAKLEGNRLLASGNARGAVDAFTRAIALDGTNHIFFSNRSAAYMSLNDPTNALKDANQCVQLNSSWAKGHSRKGAALFAKKLYGKSADAYRKASSLDPSNASYKASMAMTEKEDLYQRGVEQRPSSTPSSASTTPAATSRAAPPAASSGTLKEMLFSTRDKQIYTSLSLARVFFLVCSFGFVAGMARTFWYAMLVGTLMYASQVYFAFGKPALSPEYGQRVMTDWRTHYSMYCMLMLLQQPRLVMMMGVLVRELGNIAEFTSVVLSKISPGVLVMLTGPADSVMARLTSVPKEEWQAKTTAQKWSEHNRVVGALGANMEIGVAIMLIVDLFTPNRNIIGGFAYIQFLKIRYLFSTDLQGAGRTLDERISSKISGVPVLVQAYGYVQMIAKKLIVTEQPGAGGAGGVGGVAEQAAAMAQKCTIM